MLKLIVFKLQFICKSQVRMLKMRINALSFVPNYQNFKQNYSTMEMMEMTVLQN